MIGRLLITRWSEGDAQRDTGVVGVLVSIGCAAALVSCGPMGAAATAPPQ